MTCLYDARWSFVILKQKDTTKLLTGLLLMVNVSKVYATQFCRSALRMVPKVARARAA